MLNQATIGRLRELRLYGMAEAAADQMRQPDVNELSFEERLGLLVDQEWTYRHNRRLARLLREARLRLPACMEDIDYYHPRSLDRAVMRNLGSCSWIKAHQSVLITGPTGAGKTYIACALGNAACRQGFSTCYYRSTRLLMDLAIARADGSYPKLLQKLAKTEVLILDDWCMPGLDAEQARQMLDIIDDRVLQRSTIVASQLPIGEWHGVISDPTTADAILDRLIHGSHKLFLSGDTMRRLWSNAENLPAGSTPGKDKSDA